VYLSTENHLHKRGKLEEPGVNCEDANEDLPLKYHVFMTELDYCLMMCRRYSNYILQHVYDIENTHYTCVQKWHDDPGNILTS